MDLVGCLVGWCVCWFLSLVGWFILLIGLLVAWLVGWFLLLVALLVGSFVGWLVSWLDGCLVG